MAISKLDQLTAEWLSNALGAAVKTIDMESSTPFGAVVAYLTVEYANSAPPDAPRRLFFKMSGPRKGAEIPDEGHREVRFYEAVKARGLDLPLPRVYDAAYEDGRFHLLMDDLSETHAPAEQEIPPHEWQCEAAIDTLAMLHAGWRGDTEFLTAMGKFPLESAGWNFDLNMAGFYPEFEQWLGDRLPERTRTIFERTIDAIPRLSERYHDPARLTLIHGDAHFWNFLYPRERGKYPAYLIDWEALDIGTGLEDVAYGMTLFWSAERRARLEKKLVERYHRGLLEAGVKDTNWDDCWRDYRLATIQCLFNCLWWRRHNMPAYLWWPRLERVAAAFEDLGCEELLA